MQTPQYLEGFTFIEVSESLDPSTMTNIHLGSWLKETKYDQTMFSSWEILVFDVFIFVCLC